MSILILGLRAGRYPGSLLLSAPWDCDALTGRSPIARLAADPGFDGHLTEVAGEPLLSNTALGLGPLRVLLSTPYRSLMSVGDSGLSPPHASPSPLMPLSRPTLPSL